MNQIESVQIPELNIIQKIRLELLGITPTNKKSRPGWKGELQFYAFICPEHGLVEDYPHGYRQVLQCPYCRSNS